jgi:hypothetical protein
MNGLGQVVIVDVQHVSWTLLKCGMGVLVVLFTPHCSASTMA